MQLGARESRRNEVLHREDRGVILLHIGSEEAPDSRIGLGRVNMASPHPGGAYGRREGRDGRGLRVMHDRDIVRAFRKHRCARAILSEKGALTFGRKFGMLSLKSVVEPLGRL